MVVVVDPAVRIISETNQIFVLHPGQQKKFMQDFVESQAVFLDIPGISFPEPPMAADETVQKKLRMSRQIRTWRNRNSPEADAPSRSLDDYKAGGQIENLRFLNEVEDLYADAKAGDLIIIPGKGYGRTVFFGEFVNDFDPDFVLYPPRYKGEAVPARRVQWIKQGVAKGDLSNKLIRLLQNRQAIIRVTAPDMRHEVYERAYGDYVWGETSGNLVKVSADDVDLRDLTKAADLTNYFAAQFIALRKGELETFLSLPFEEAIETYYDKTYFGGVSVEIHSPGFFGRPMRNAAMAGYVSVMLALSAAGISAQEGTELIVQNSVNSIVSICDVELEADLRQTMNMYANMELWEDQICPKRQQAQVTVGLTTDVSIEIVDDATAPASSTSKYSGGQQQDAPAPSDPE